MEQKRARTAGNLRRVFSALIFSCVLLIAASCGIDDVPDIKPVPQSSITKSSNDRARVDLRYYMATPYFSHFAVFYRIYVSNSYELAPSPSNFYTINSTLSQNYSTVAPWIDNENIVGQNMHDSFRKLNYWYLALQNANIDTVLNTTNAVGNIIEFDFGAAKNPVMTISATDYTLRRSGDIFNPKPADKLFRNTADLRNATYIGENDNADVVDSSGTGNRDFTYVAMFIVAVGFDYDYTFSNFYSTPSLIHVFQLPD
jgi:hypothetical protein